MTEAVSAILQTANFPPVLLLFGEEDFLLEEALRQLVEKASESDISRLNIDNVEGSETTPERIVELAQAFPMMADRRVVIVKNFQKMSFGKTNKKKADVSPFGRYIQSPSESTFLVLVGAPQELNGISPKLKNPKMKAAAEKKISSAKFPYNIIFSKSNWIEFPAYSERDVPSWIMAVLKQKGRTATPEACRLIAATFNGSLREVYNEIEKALLFVGGKKSITLEDIAPLIGGSKTHNIFELQKAVGKKDLPLSLEIADYLVSVERQELLLLSMLTRYFSVLWKLSEVSRQTRDNYEISRTVGVNVFFIPEYIAALRHYTVDQLEQNFFYLRETDVALKTSAMPVNIAIPRLITALIAP